MGAAWWLGHDPQSLLWTLGIPFLGLVVAMRIYGDYWHLFHKLRRAEDAVRELAVVNERLKLSRDLHDIVGHSLSVMALRAELAARQAEAAAPAAADEMLHVVQTARDALRDVRAVISRWRVVSFVEEWGNAERVLASAGITALTVFTLGDLQLPPEVDRVFGFFVREGVTNILRHSRATECRLMVRKENLTLSIRLEDNGHQDTALAEDGGSGIVGLRERFAELGGSVAAALQASGYVLESTLPWIDPRTTPHAAH
ncbi:MAG: histidine kinase [Thermaerobacter sp.]|nr:histidine kinase [Thermaerobacter sp.]